MANTPTQVFNALWFFSGGIIVLAFGVALMMAGPFVPGLAVSFVGAAALARVFLIIRGMGAAPDESTKRGIVEAGPGIPHRQKDE